MAVIVIIEEYAYMKNGIIFDLDGTLWDSAETVTRAFNDEIKNYDDVDYTLTEEVLKQLWTYKCEEKFYHNTTYGLNFI